MMTDRMPSYGALVISLDVERHWGVRDVLKSNSGYLKNLDGEIGAIRQLLALFDDFNIAATWATVGLIFARSKDELIEFKPLVAPQYRDPNLSPFDEIYANGASLSSVREGADIVGMIVDTPLQRLGTHTFSHYYCLEEGQNAESFSSDIKSAVAIAARRGVKIESIVFPRNQHNRSYDLILKKYGIKSFRGNQESRFYDFNRRTQSNRIYRAVRLADSYLNISGLNTLKWSEMYQDGLVNLRASMFLRPVERRESYLNDLQYRRIRAGLDRAAREGEVFHLWWHPHNFGVRTSENIEFLRRILARFGTLRDKYGMRSFSMEDAADKVLRGRPDRPL